LSLTIEQAVRDHVATIFEPLKRIAAARAFPPPTTLSAKLESLLPKPSAGVHLAHVSPELAAVFATAAVDVWMRSVHSFLISASLEHASPIWASASGYYSSHYSVRAFAHLFGHFQLHQKRRKVRLEILKGRFVCTFDPKQAGDREHQYYWKALKQSSLFAADPYFTSNDGGAASEVGHRDRANYADHLGLLPKFRSLEEGALRQRVHYISQIQFSAPPIPSIGKFPDVDAVQIIAYHRLVRFRQVLDEVLGGSNRFWNLHRTPSWTNGMIDFQITEQSGILAIQAQ
jgi:hypothetical protein